jgi:putative addiction module CopG family antidote
MTIHLSKELEQFVHDAVRAGLYAREDDVIRDALIRLKQAMPEGTQTPGHQREALDRLCQKLDAMPAATHGDGLTNRDHDRILYTR